MAPSIGTSRDTADTICKEESSDISMLALLIAIGQKKRMVAISTAIALAIGFLLAFLLPDKYTAQITLLPPRQQSSLNSILASQLGSLGGIASLAGGNLGLKNPNDTYTAMFRSRTVEDALILKFGLIQEYHDKLMSRARRDFESASSVNGTMKDGMIHISVTDRSPQRAAELANGYVMEFRKLSNRLAITNAAQRRLFFQQQMEATKNELTNAEVALVRTEKQTGMIEVGSQAKALIQTGADLNARIAAKKVEIKGMEAFAAPGNPSLIQARQELDALQNELTGLAGNGGNSQKGLILPRGELPSAGLQYLRKYRDVEYYQTIFNILARQFELAKLDEAREGALIQVLDPATPPDSKSSPKRLLILSVSLTGGLFLGIFLALGAAALDSLNANPETRAQFNAVRNAFRLRALKR